MGTLFSILAVVIRCLYYVLSHIRDVEISAINRSEHCLLPGSIKVLSLCAVECWMLMVALGSMV